MRNVWTWIAGAVCLAAGFWAVAVAAGQAQPGVATAAVAKSYGVYVGN